MGKSIKKILKAVETKNGKIKEREGGMEKSQVKDRPKVRSLWSKWSSLFNRTSSSRLRSAKTSSPQLSEAPQIPQIMMNNLPKDLERWSHDESLDVNSQMLNIPIEPGRQVSTIILSPTKTGFKAVIAHYDVNASLRHSLTKDFKTISEQIENRRTLTLVFDMNQRTFEEIGVGKSQCRVDDEGQDHGREDKRNISASALYVRNDADELVESAAFLQAQLSLDDTALNGSSLFISEEKSINLERRPLSCRSIERSRVAFKTISEPMWQEKEKMRKEMLIKQNVQEMLNQFIFLERDDSLMNYPKVCEEESLNVEELKEEQGDSDEKEEKESIDAKSLNTDYFLPGRFSVINTNSTRNVAPNLLVNIKPFKQYIGSCPKIDIQQEKLAYKKVEIKTRKTDKYLSRPSKPMPPASFRKNSKELRSRPEVKLQKPNTKSRLSLCIKCGTEVRKDGAKSLTGDKGIYVGKNIYKTNDYNSVTTQTGKCRSSMAIASSIREDMPCTLCSVWKMYKKKSSFTSISHIGDSFDDILKEFEGYNHNMIFQQNISQFKTKINANSPSIEFKKSHSSLSFAEVIELEQGKISQVKNAKAVLEDSKMDDMQRVTVRLIEFVRKNKEKTVEFQRIKTAMEQLYFEKVPLEPTVEIFRFENSSLVFTFRESNKMIKVMAQKIEENMLKSFSNANELKISEASTTVIFPAQIQWAKVPMHHSENRLDKFKRSFTNYNRAGQIPDVINHLLSNKVVDLRNELIMSLNETRMSYNSDSYHTVEIERVNREEEYKSKKSTSYATCSTSGGSDGKEQYTNAYVEGNIKSAAEENAEKERTEHHVEEYKWEHIEVPDEQNIEQYFSRYDEDYKRERPKTRTEDVLQPYLLSSSSISKRSSSYSKSSRQCEQNFGENLEKILEDFESNQEKVTERIPVPWDTAENYELTKVLADSKNLEYGYKQKALSFKGSSDFKVHSCLTFFIPYVQQIQTAIEILNNVTYDFPVREEGAGRVNKDCIQIMRSYTLLSNKKKCMIDRGVESVIAKKCVEKNIINGIETSKASKKEITTIESSKSGNHLLVTNQRILRTNDRIKKTELVGGAVEAENNNKILQGSHDSVLFRTNLPEDSEDINGIRFLYCNRTDGYGTCESSVASNFSYGLDKVRESSSSVIAVNELGETMRAFTDVKLSDTGEQIQGYCQQTATDCEYPNKVDNSLQEIDDGTGHLQNGSMKCEIVSPSPKAKDSVSNNEKSGRLGSANKETKNQSSVIDKSQVSITKRDSVQVKMTEEKVIVKGQEVSKILLPQNIRTPNVKVFKIVGKGIVSQRVATKSCSGGREMLVRQEDEVSKKKENSNSKRMSVVIMLSKGKKESERSSSAPGKYYTNCQSSKGIIKLTEVNSTENGSTKSIRDADS